MSPLPILLSAETEAKFEHASLQDRPLRDILPDAQEREAYMQWQDQQMASRWKAMHTSRISAPMLANMIDTTRYFHEGEYEKLAQHMEHGVVPYIPLGRIGYTYFRLGIDNDLLRPTSDEFPSTQREVLSRAFLGLNTTVQPRQPALPASRRAANLSEESTQSAETDDSDTGSPGFVFTQLGCLEFCVEPEGSGVPDADDYGWDESNFCVVARLRPDLAGSVAGLYVIYNMTPLNDDGERVTITGPNWGHTPDGDHFAVARLGPVNKLADLTASTELCWSEKIEHPVELVRVAQDSMGRGMRVTVDHLDGRRA